jgi:DNA-binding IscR family transcriptional regulator
MKLSTGGRYRLRTLLDLALRRGEGLIFTIQSGLGSFVEVLRVKA